MVFEFTKEDVDNFWKNVNQTYCKDGTNNCWLWEGEQNTAGYGIFPNSTDVQLAHRFSVLLHGREIPDKLVVDHMCRSRNCVNPAHLQITTQKKNLEARGRKQSLNGKDEVYEEEEPLTNFQMCLRKLEESFFMVGVDVIGKNSEDVGKQAVIEMIKVKLRKNSNDFNHELNGEERIEGYKRKYFLYIEQILNDYNVTFKSVIEHYKID